MTAAAKVPPVGSGLEHPWHHRVAGTANMAMDVELTKANGGMYIDKTIGKWWFHGDFIGKP